MEGRVMGIYIKGFKPQDGLYVIKDRVIRKYKAKGGTVRPYELIEVKEPLAAWLKELKEYRKELGKILSEESEEDKRFREVFRGFLELVEATKEE